nr:MAG: hypothetical protein 1 [Dicistroviridae sp.]
MASFVMTNPPSEKVVNELLEISYGTDFITTAVLYEYRSDSWKNVTRRQLQWMKALQLEERNTIPNDLGRQGEKLPEGVWKVDLYGPRSERKRERHQVTYNLCNRYHNLFTEGPQNYVKDIKMSKVFFVTSHVIMQRFVVEECDWERLFMIPDDDDVVAERYRTLRRCFKKVLKFDAKMRQIEAETLKKTKEQSFIEDCIDVAHDLRRMRHMDRTFRLLGRLPDQPGIPYRLCPDCPYNVGCETCNKCMLHCGNVEHIGSQALRETLLDFGVAHSGRVETREEKIARDKKKDRLRSKIHDLKEIRIKGPRQPDLDLSILTSNEGPAHAWFFPDIPSDFNLNVHFPFLEGFVKALEEKDNTIPWQRILTDFFYLTVHLLAAKSKKTCLIAISHFILSLPVSQCILNQLIARVPGWFSVNAQASDVEGLLVPILTLLGVCVSVLGVKQLPSDKSITDFINRLSKIGGCVKSVETLKEYILPAVETVIDYIRVNIFGYSSRQMDSWKSYNSFCDEVSTLNNTGFEERLKTERELVVKIDELLIRGDNLAKMLDQLRIPATQRSRFNNSYAWLARMRTEAAFCSAGKHIPRVPPVIFHIVGKTGVGKSEATSLLNARLLTRLGYTDPSDLHTMVYYRDCGQERFDGYNSGIVGVVVDDFGSRVDSAANPSSEPFEVIRMQNSAVWQLPMASLSEKGSTFFRAKYVIWTSNQATFKFESITNPEAVLRRVTLKFVQRPRPEFSMIRKIGSTPTETLDNIKVAEAAKTNPDVYDDVWLFDLIDPQEDPSPRDDTTGGFRVLKTGLSFDEMAQMCEQTLMRAQVVGQAKLDHTASYFKKCAEKLAREGDAQGCDWFGFFGRSNDQEPIQAEHCSVNRLLRDRSWNGKDLTPTGKTYASFMKLDNSKELWSGVYGAHCLVMKARTKVQERFYRALVEGYAVAELERANGHPDPEKVFCDVLMSYTVPRSVVETCAENHLSERFYETVHSFSQYVKRAAWKIDEYIPQGWKVPISEAFEFACGVLLQFIATTLLVCGFALLYELLYWLYPGLHPARQERERVRDRVEEEAKRWVPKPGAELQLLLDLVHGPLEFDPKAVAAALEEFQARQDALEENTESHQDRTTGARKCNVESHQMKTNGPTRINVESHQDRTNGNRRVNVENAQATNDQNAQEVMYRIKRNVYGVQVNRDGEWTYVGGLLFIKGKLAILNRHVLKLVKDREFRLFNDNTKKGMIVTNEQSLNLNVSYPTGLHETKDVVLIEMPRHSITHADITSYFMTKADFSYHKEISQVCVLGYGADLSLQQRYSDKCQAIDRTEFRLVERDSATTLVRDWYRYGVHSRPGDCGSVAMAFDPSVQRKIFGIHMAGYDSEGYYGVAVAVHQELLQSLQKTLVLRNAESNLDGTFELEGEITERTVPGDFVAYGKAMSCTTSAATAIRRSPLYGKIATPTTAPAVLRPIVVEGKVIDPLEKAREKADTPNVAVEEATLKQCSAHYAQLLMDLKNDDADDKVLTWEEAICGVEGDHFYSAVKRNTSPGYGWKSKGCGKEPWLGKDTDFVTDHPDVLTKRDEMMTRLRNGKRASTVFIDTLKDERRTLDKVAVGKTRLFAAGEMVYCLIFRQYFAGFNAHIMKNQVMAESTVGINAFGQMWSTLANRMREMGPDVVAGDFSNYDGTLSSAIMWEVLDVVETFYENATEEDRQVRRGLWCDLVNSVHATTPFNGTNHGTETILYQWNHSQPSGNPMTVILNSVYHSIVARYVFKLCARRYCPTLVGLNSWDRYVRHANYGDDDLYNISPEIVEWFNQITMSEMFKEIGMTYTDEAKTGELVKSRRLEDVAFLKRKFRWDADQARWRCPHSLDVILEMPMWVKRSANTYTLTAEVLEEAVHELAQHPKQVWDEYIDRFQEARKALLPKATAHILSYDEYQEIEMARMEYYANVDPRDAKRIDAFFY